MAGTDQRTLLAAVCDFGWGSLGKFRLILDRLPDTEIVLFGEAGINDLAAEMLGHRFRFAQRPPQSADAALVINDPVLANRIGELGVPVIYVDSLPYLWASASEIPERRNVAYYCAQKFPIDRMAVSPPLQDWPDIRWIDPIVPPRARRDGGKGVVISVGGLHSHLVGGAVDAYLDLVVLPLVAQLAEQGRGVAGVCGNLPTKVCEAVRKMLPACPVVGRQSPYDFEALLRGADLLVASPGSTTILQAMTMRLPTLLLPPQNLSQMMNARLFSASGAPLLDWPQDVLSRQKVEDLQPHGEEAVLGYIYDSICRAAGSAAARARIADQIRGCLLALPQHGNLDFAVLEALGTNGAAQVAQLIRQVMFVPLSHRKPALP